MHLDLTTERRVYGGLLAGIALLALLAISALAYSGRDAKAVTSASAGSGPVPVPANAHAGNWNFERGDLRGWHTRSQGSGAWYVYADGTKPPNPAETDPDVPFSVPAPPEGRHAAVTDMTAPGSRVMYRDVELHGRNTLRFALFYTSAGPLASPDSLKFDTREPNQQLRVEIMDASAPVSSTSPKHVLATVFQTEPDDPSAIAPRTVSFDLSEWAGDRVRLRFAQVDNSGPLRAGIDDVRLERIGAPNRRDGLRGQPRGPSRSLSLTPTEVRRWPLHAYGAWTAPRFCGPMPFCAGWRSPGYGGGARNCSEEARGRPLHASSTHMSWRCSMVVRSS